ncbi:MAG: hypothetical protein K6357_01765 [Elusimicrobiota bacterium]
MKNDIDKVKFFVFSGVFGVLWGVFEMLIGSYLHILNLPLRGAFMSGFGCVFMCVLRSYVNYKGVNLYAAIVAISIKLLSYGGFKLGPIVGIFIEAVIIEVIFGVFNFNKFSIIFSSLLCVLEGVPHFFITTWIMYGGGIFEVYLNAMANISKIFGFSKEIYIYVFLIWLFAHFLIGFFSSFVSIKLIGWLKNEIH